MASISQQLQILGPKFEHIVKILMDGVTSLLPVLAPATQGMSGNFYFVMGLG